MGRMAEYQQCQEEQEQYRDDNGMWECEFNEWMQAHEQETAQRVAVATACRTDSGLNPF